MDTAALFRGLKGVALAFRLERYGVRQDYPFLRGGIMKAAVFCRVSSKEQEVEGYSLPAQEKLLRGYADVRGFKTTNVFSITESASGKKQREIFDGMIAFLKKNDIKVIVCEKVDRLTRNLKDAVEINEWINGDPERQVHFVKENVVLNKDSKSNEKFIWNIKVSVAQYYIDNLSEEVKKGQKEKLSQGWLPTKPPLGYKTVGEKGHKIHVIDEDKAPYVRKMFELYATGNYSLTKLVGEMYKEGLRTRGGFKLVKSRLHDILGDPFYVGKLRWNGEVSPGKHVRLIEDEIFDKVQKLLKSKTTPKYNKHNFLFKGLLHCGNCGGSITWETQKGTVYGHCNHYRDCTQTTWSKQGDVELQLVKEFGNLEIENTRIVEWIRKALKEHHKEEIDYHSTSLNDLNLRHDQINQRLDKLYDDKLDEKVTPDFYDRKFKQYTNEKEQITTAIQKLANASTKYYQLGINIFELSQRAKEIYFGIKDEGEKRELINLVFSGLTLDEGKLTVKHSKPFRLLIEAVRLTNSSKVEEDIKTNAKIFEPEDLITLAVQNALKQAHSPIWLRR